MRPTRDVTRAVDIPEASRPMVAVMLSVDDVSISVNAEPSTRRNPKRVPTIPIDRTASDANQSVLFSCPVMLDGPLTPMKAEVTNVIARIKKVR